ncbi:MAG: DUF167 domain-containing protein [Phycisphaerae bacterium]|nr:DUF167 domain-containing protein [Gemmatimonadaceae bacterium]
MLSEFRGTIRLAVHVQPGARSNSVLGEHGGALKIAVAAPPVDGKANEAVASFVADAFGLPRRAVAVVAGHQSRRKVLGMEGLSLADAQNRLTELLPRGS